MEDAVKPLVVTATLLLALGLAGPLGAQQPPDDPLARLLFPPELVMQHQTEIGLRPEQRTAITRAIADFQSRVVEVQWRMQQASETLGSLLGRPVVDQDAALAQVDEVLRLEREVKRGHLALLIEIKNALTPEQQARLGELRGR